MNISCGCLIKRTLLQLIERLPVLLIERIHGSEEKQRVVSAVKISTWEDSLKKKAIVSSRYLNSVGKGENALELASALKDNLLSKGTNNFVEVIVPEYITKAIKWVCE